MGLGMAQPCPHRAENCLAEATREMPPHTPPCAERTCLSAPHRRSQPKKRESSDGDLRLRKTRRNTEEQPEEEEGGEDMMLRTKELEVNERMR